MTGQILWRCLISWVFLWWLAQFCGGVWLAWQLSVCGDWPGFVEVSIMHPLDLIKTRFQIQTGPSDPYYYTSITHCCKQMYRLEGWVSLCLVSTAHSLSTCFFLKIYNDFVKFVNKWEHLGEMRVHSNFTYPLSSLCRIPGRFASVFLPSCFCFCNHDQQDSTSIGTVHPQINQNNGLLFRDKV